jgi:large subunit ribosomal protein L28
LLKSRLNAIIVKVFAIHGKEVIHMGKKCYVTGKTTKFGQNRSFAENKSKRKFKANLQKVRILVDGKPKRVYVSTKALKAGLVERV